MASMAGSREFGFGAHGVTICRCEEIAQDDVVAALRAGAVTVNDVKRRTRAGMGLCQGVYCVPAIAVLTAQMTATPIERIAPMTARAPVRPAPLDALADLAETEHDDGWDATGEEG